MAHPNRTPLRGVPERYLSFSDTVGLIAIQLSIICWIFVPTLLTRALGMLLWTVGVVFLVYRSHYSAQISKMGRHVVASVLCVLIIIIFSYLLHTQYREESAAKNEGDLIAPEGDVLPDGSILLKIGDSNVVFENKNSDPRTVPFFSVEDSRFYLWKENGKLQIKATVRDEGGNLVAELNPEKGVNHWKTFPAFVSDKNYDKNSLEVKDTKGRIVLQVRMLAGCVELQEKIMSGYGQELDVVSQGDGIHAEIGMNPDNQKHPAKSIAPIFKYPSIEHWKELVSTEEQNCNGQRIPKVAEWSFSLRK